MAMTVLNNTASMMTLGELNKNITQVGKELARISSGQRIRGAGDGASEYAISEKMRVRIRALDQDKQNVQTGANLLQIAAGAIQEQMDIMKKIKEKVLDAANDSNTDIDRATIQKEITHGLKQIETIAYDTTYNGKHILLGSETYGEKVLDEWDESHIEKILLGQRVEWEILSGGTQDVDGSSLDIIPDDFPELDGVQGPFAVFEPYHAGRLTSIDSLSIFSNYNMNYFSGGENGTPNHVIVDLSSYGSVEELDGVGFVVGDSSNRLTYILTTDPDARFNNSANNTVFGINYQNSTTKNSNYKMIDISGCNEVWEVAEKIKSASYTYFDTERDGEKITFKTKDGYLSDLAETNNNRTIVSAEASNADTREVIIQQYSPAGTTTVSERKTGTYTAGSTGRVPSPNTLGGGEMKITNPDNEPDITPQDGKSPWLEMNVSGVAAGTGITIHGPSGTAYLQFSSDSSELSRVTGTNGYSTGVYSVGTSYSGSFSLAGLNLTMSGGTLKLEVPLRANVPVENGKYSVTEGISTSYTYYDSKEQEIPEVPEVKATYEFRAVKTLNDIDNKRDAGDPTYATYKIDLGPYVGSTDMNKLDSLINDMTGKALKYFSSKQYYYGYNYVTYQFKDSDMEADEFSKTDLNGRSVRFYGVAEQISGATQIDLAPLRTAVKNGTSIDQAMKDLLTSTMLRATSTSDGGLIRVPDELTGTRGNSTSTQQYVTASEGCVLSHYDVDFKTYLENNPGLKVPDDLYGKGFRVYCASDPDQWFNFTFTGNVIEGQEDKPELEDVPDVKNIFVDISEAEDAASLVVAIRNSAETQLDEINHYIHIEANPSSGILTIYDDRPFNPKDDPRLQQYPEKLREKGAKIMDGVMDYLGKTFINLYRDETVVEHKVRSILKKSEGIIIHDTDKASMNIHLRIPRMTLDQIFEYPPGEMKLEDFNVMTKEMRDKLLGKNSGSGGGAAEKGFLDTAIEYMADANTLIGAQMARLDHTFSNLVSASENTISSESVIRDADMAKEMVEYTKANILMQGAQGMLSQANQTASGVLGLLQ